MGNAYPLGCFGEVGALANLTLNPGIAPILHGMNAVDSIEGTGEGNLVFEIAARYFDAVTHQWAGLGMVWIACERSHGKTAVAQMPEGGPALAAGGPGYQDQSPFVPCFCWHAAGEARETPTLTIIREAALFGRSVARLM